MAIPTVTTTSVTSVTTTSCYAYANMTNTGGTPLAWRGIGYKDITTGGGENTIWVSDYYGSGDPPGSYGCTIGVGYFLLVPGHFYDIRAIATNDKSNYAFGSYIRIQTVGPPTLTASTPTATSDTSITAYGNITNTGENSGTSKPNRRGFCYSTHASPDISSGVVDEYGTYGTGAYSLPISGLTSGTTYYVRAFAVNSGQIGYSPAPGATVRTLGIPLAPTNCTASWYYTTYIQCSWTASATATNYRVYRDGVDISGLLGNVTTYYDYAAPGEPGFYPGNAGATKGTIVEYVGLTLSGSYQYPSPSHEYKVVAINSYGTSSFSNTASGNKVLGARTYQWQRSAGDSNASYSNILGATSTSHNDTGAPADGSGRYYRCVENGVGGAQQISVVDRGYRKLPLIPIVYTYDASEINVSSCIGNGYIGGIGDTNVTRVGFYYLKGTDGTPGPLNPDSLEVGTDVNYGIPTLYQKPITGLVSGAPYRIRAYAINTIGTAYGDTIQIFTKFIPQISWLL